jgi:hypothetical protein
MIASNLFSIEMMPGSNRPCSFAPRFPSPRPSPSGRGRKIARLSTFPTPLTTPCAALCFPLSLRERVRVRGNEAFATVESTGRFGQINSSSMGL